MAAARIRTIRLKSGGAELRILRQELPDNDGKENWCGRAMAAARKCTEFSTPESELCGFVVVGFYTDGATSLGYRMDPARSGVPGALVPSYVAELIRRDVVTKIKFDDMFERT